MERNKINADIFRKYDIRGIVDNDLNNEVLETLGRGIGSYLNDKVIVARDNRLSSEGYKNKLVSGLIATGCDVVDLGEIPTPIFYYGLRLLKIGNGAMITGSHNPKEYNGVKIVKDEKSVYGDEVQKIREICNKGRFLKGRGKIEERNVVNDYFEMIKKKIKLNKRLKVVVDCGNGTLSDFAPKLLREVGCEVVELYCKSDGRFPNHHPDPSKHENYKDLMKKVKEKKADLGLAFDGDGDRLGVVTEDGEMIYADQLIMVLAKEVLEKNPGCKIAVEVKCSQATIEYIEANNGRVVMSPTGHSLIENVMIKEDALLAGEMSGHIYFRDEFYGSDDAMYVSLRVLRILSNSKERLGEMLKKLPRYYSTPEIRLKCNDKDKFKIVEDASRYFKSKYKCIDIDGVRVLFKDGWGGIRASNTEPVLSVRCEGKTKEALEGIKNVIRNKLKEYHNLEVDFRSKGL